VNLKQLHINLKVETLKFQQMLYSNDIVHKLIHCASNINISKSTPYSNPANPMKGLIYTSNSVSIVYTKDKLRDK
jgi:hypothetical protein